MSDDMPVIEFVQDALDKNLYENLKWVDRIEKVFILFFPKKNIPRVLLSDAEREQLMRVFKDYSEFMNHDESFDESTDKRRLVEAMTQNICLIKIKFEKRGLPKLLVPPDEMYDDISMYHFKFASQNETVVKRHEKKVRQSKYRKRSIGKQHEKEARQRKYVKRSSSSDDSGYDSFPKVPESAAVTSSLNNHLPEAIPHIPSDTCSMFKTAGASNQFVDVQTTPHLTAEDINRSIDEVFRDCLTAPVNMSPFSDVWEDTSLNGCFPMGDSLPTSLDASCYDDTPLLVKNRIY